jgi:hypothetical protein
VNPGRLSGTKEGLFGTDAVSSLPAGRLSFSGQQTAGSVQPEKTLVLRFRKAEN